MPFSFILHARINLSQFLKGKKEDPYEGMGREQYFKKSKFEYLVWIILIFFEGMEDLGKLKLTDMDYFTER